MALQHVPGLVRYGSKPRRERHRMEELCASLRSYGEAVAYPPNQVFIGNERPDALWDAPRPLWTQASGGRPVGPFGDILDERGFYELLAEADHFDLIRLKDGASASEGELPLYADEEVVGSIRPAHEADEALSSLVLLENLACKASAAHAVRSLLSRGVVDPDRIGYVLGSGEEAVGDRYQRGGGNLGKAVAEMAGLGGASGADVKAFCAGPLHAIVVAAALVATGVHEHVLVVAGGSLAKLGMKFLGALEKGSPILEDVLAGMAVLIGVDQGDAPILRLDAIGTHRVASGSSQRALLEDVVGRPLDALGIGVGEVDRYATELHNPEITVPAGGGDVPDRNYRMVAGLGVLRGELDRAAIDAFAREHGLPGYAPTQGHIASAVPWIPHALEGLARGELHRTMLLAKGSLFLGRMTQLWDGASITLEV
jgi:glycine/sarcosine/betaine reductase complex component C subunit beta